MCTVGGGLLHCNCYILLSTWPKSVLCKKGVHQTLKVIFLYVSEKLGFKLVGAHLCRWRIKYMLSVASSCLTCAVVQLRSHILVCLGVQLTQVKPSL